MDTNQEHLTPFEQEDLLNQQLPDYKIFSLNQIVSGSFFGGPFAGAYMVANNVKKLKPSIQVWQVWASVFGVMIISLAPDFLGIEHIPGIVYNLFYCMGVYWVAKGFIGNKIQDHVNAGGLYWEVSRVVAVVVVSIVVLFLFIAFVFILIDFKGFVELFT